MVKQNALGAASQCSGCTVCALCLRACSLTVNPKLLAQLKNLLETSWAQTFYFCTESYKCIRQKCAERTYVILTFVNL